MPQTTELAFESYVENILHSSAGWEPGLRAEWDVERGLFPARVIRFIRDTQPDLWAQMARLHGAALDGMCVDALVNELDVKGALHVLRHGFKFYGKTFHLAYFKPAHSLNEDVSNRA